MTPWETSLSQSACQDSASAACKAPGDCLTGEGPSRAWDLAVELVMRNAKQLTVRAGRVARGLSTWFACEILGSVLRCWEWNQGDGGACMPLIPIPWRPRWQEKLELKVSLATRCFFFLSGKKALWVKADTVTPHGQNLISSIRMAEGEPTLTITLWPPHFMACASGCTRTMNLKLVCKNSHL